MRLGLGFVFVSAVALLAVAMFLGPMMAAKTHREPGTPADSLGPAREAAARREFPRQYAQILRTCRGAGVCGPYSTDGLIASVQVGVAWYSLTFDQKESLAAAIQYTAKTETGGSANFVRFVDKYTGKVVAELTPFDGFSVK